MNFFSFLYFNYKISFHVESANFLSNFFQRVAFTKLPTTRTITRFEYRLSNVFERFVTINRLLIRDFRRRMPEGDANGLKLRIVPNSTPENVKNKVIKVGTKSTDRSGPSRYYPRRTVARFFAQICRLVLCLSKTEANWQTSKYESHPRRFIHSRKSVLERSIEFDPTIRVNL